MRAMLVAAGLGTRLSPLTDMLPKPAVPVANHAVAGFVMAHLRGFGITDFTANAYHLPDALQAALERERPLDASISVVREHTLLGTGGGIRNALTPEAGESILVANAKVLFRPDLQALGAAHLERRSFATMVLRSMPKAASFGAVDVDADGRVRAILAEQPAPGLRRCMFSGMQLLSDRAHDRLPREGCLIRDGYQRWLAEGEAIHAVVDEAPFTDVGVTLAAYHQSNMNFCTGAEAWPHVLPDRRGCIVADDAHHWPGVNLEDCVIGAGARLGPGRLERVVVWPGCQTSGDLNDCVVTPVGIVSVR